MKVKIVGGNIPQVQKVEAPLSWVEKQVEKEYDFIVESIVTDLAFEVEMCMMYERLASEELRTVCEAPNTHDIFQVANARMTTDVECANCGRTIVASRFAPHLEKCIGLGRSSSRIATRRIAATSNVTREPNSDETSDGDTVSVPKQRLGRKRKIRGRTKRKMMPEDEYATLDYDQRQNLLSHTCGVVSELTGKSCNRSIRCPVHTDEQKNNVRMTMLNGNVEIVETVEFAEPERVCPTTPVRKSERKKWLG